MRCRIALALIVFGLGGCATQPESGKHLFVNIKYVGARDELSKVKALETTTRSEYVLGTEGAATMDLSTATVCDKEKARCRSGVLSTELKYKIDTFDGQTVTISGKIISVTSRNVTTVSFRPSLRTTQRMGLAEGAEFIGESREERPFTGRMDLGQSLDLEGVLGAKMTLWFEEKRS